MTDIGLSIGEALVKGQNHEWRCSLAAGPQSP
jgi:hypothetical protein